MEYCKSRSRDMWREMLDVELAEATDANGDDALAMEAPASSSSPNTRHNIIMELIGRAKQRPRRYASGGSGEQLCCTW